MTKLFPRRVSVTRRDKVKSRLEDSLTCLAAYLATKTDAEAAWAMVGDPTAGFGDMYRFAHCELDERAHELRVNGTVVALQAKALGVLLCLLRRPDETLTKDELFEAVWPGRVVTEGVLAKAVMKLRAVLGDEDQVLVRTVHGYGYRLGVPVQRQGSDASSAFVASSGEPVPQRRNWRLLQALDAEHRGLVWLAEHLKTRERRVFKFANNADTLVTLKREITLYRLFHDSLGEDAPVVRILDWNLDQPPYFTESEWISGGDLSLWISSQADFEERIEVVAQVCEAVAATHAVGVVHKDIKPANVLVRRLDDGSVQIRLADFGIGALSDAAAIEALGITRMGFTRTQSEPGSSSGTPLYLAPEVIAGRMPTQRSDIYALGVILYQTLVADPRRPLAPGWDREIEDPLLREDIAAAADVDPLRRLGDAAELARRLCSLPQRRAQRAAAIEAQERARKLDRRLQRTRLQRRWMASLAALLLIAVIGMSTLAWHAEQARQLAQHEAAKAEAINHFLHHDVLGASDIGRQGDYTRPIGSIIEAALDRVDAAFPGQPEIAGEVYRTLGSAMLRYGSYQQGERALLRALELLEPELGAVAEPVLRMRMLLAETYAEMQRTPEARQQLERVLTELGSGELADELRARTHLQQAWLDFLDGDLHSCATRYSQWLDSSHAQFEKLHPLAFSGHARCLSALGRHDEALPAAEMALQLNTERYGPDALPTLRVQFSVASALRGLGRLQEAEQVLARLQAGVSERVGDDNALRSLAAHMLASVVELQGRPGEAVHWYQQAVEARVRAFGEADYRTWISRAALGFALLGDAQPEAAEQQIAALEHYVANTERVHPALLRLVATTGEQLAQACSPPVRDLLEASQRAAEAQVLDALNVQQLQLASAECALSMGEPAPAPVKLDAMIEAPDPEIAQRAMRLREAHAR